jgi:CspA family cold shock protein
MEGRQSGTVMWFLERKGVGFIAHDGSDIKILVHISTLEKAGLATLEAGQKVHFSVLENDLGNFVAIDLTLDD